MVAQRRFAPLMIAVLFGLVVLWARMFRVQVVEHEIWAREAANLVRSSTIIPYHRGSIRARDGRLLVQDEELFRIELVYRDFRRGHPLGQVAHARSALEMRAVSLPEALANLRLWATELASLSPAQVDAFGRGESLDATTLRVPASVDPRAERRAGRASDLRFYIGRLLHAERSELSELRKLRGERAERSYVELLAELRREDEVADIERRLALDMEAARSHLEELARLLSLGFTALELKAELEELGRSWPSGAAALYVLLHDLEDARRTVENDAADDLFRWAAGFHPGRLRTRTLASYVSLGWIAARQRWDVERLAQWVLTRRAHWSDARDHSALPQALAELELSGDDFALAERLLSALTALVSEPSSALDTGRPDWRAADELVVLDSLDTLFALGDARPRSAGPLFAWQGRELRRAYFTPRQAGELLAAADPRAAGQLASDQDPSASDRGALAAFWNEILSSRAGLRSEACYRAALELLEAWEELLQEEIEGSLRELVAQGARAPFRLAPGRIDRATERSAYILRDRGSRPIVLRSEPDYDVIFELTRFPERYRGFHVRDTTRRSFHEFDEHGVAIAEGLIGHVRLSNLKEVLGQRRLERRLAELKRKTRREAADEAEIRELIARLYRRDELHGGGGIESHLDLELRGQNGYRETEGLQERADHGRRSLYQEPVDGSEVTLTLDLDLQRAALETLEHPEHDPNDPQRDDVWLAHPVGAIILATPDGEVLVAASVPTIEREASPTRDGESGVPRERALTRPTFQPPGSAFKPFVAAWALENVGLDPAATFPCEPDPEEQWALYKDLHCNTQWGHKDVDLHEALMRSCNIYFAHVGELLTPSQFIEVCDLFGFGQPTGVSLEGPRRELREDWSFADLRLWAAEPAARPGPKQRRAANGLQVVQSTPMQLARATCALATGLLPDMCLVRSIAGSETTKSAQALPLSRGTLERIHAALASVVTDSQGTAHGKGLGETSLGFSAALKTGSADYANFKSAERSSKKRKMRKHTWITGWFPREEPEAVLVVYLHDVSETSSHSAVYVARQFLRTQAVRSFLERRGVELTSEEEGEGEEEGEEGR